MLYVNISRERKLIPSRRVKVWVNPGQSVEVDSVDAKFLGINASSLMPKDQYDKIMAKRKAKLRAKRAKMRAAAKAARKPVPKKKTPIKEKVKKLVKKVVKKGPTPAELKKQRAELKEILTAMTKPELIDFAGDALDLGIKRTDKKDSIITKALNAAKKVGYKKIIKKA